MCKAPGLRDDEAGVFLPQAHGPRPAEALAISVDDLNQSLFIVYQHFLPGLS